jgi:hypothetical protein
MTTPKQPATEAGRALLERLRMLGNEASPGYPVVVAQGLVDAVVAIEAEAAAPLLDRVAPLLEAAYHAYNSPTKEHRAVKSIVALLVDYGGDARRALAAEGRGE